MITQLVVVRPFGTHAKGDVITDPAAIAAVLQGEQSANVVRVIQSAATPTQGS